MADLGQGSPLPNITTTQAQTTTAPQFYTNYLTNLANQGQAAGAGAQYAGATGLQNQAFNQVGQNVGNYQPNLNAATNLATTAGNTNIADTVSQFMNPYTQNVVNSIGNLGNANIAQNLAPQTTAGIVGSGQFGSQRGAGALGSVLANAALGVTNQQAQALQTGYSQALQAAQNQTANQLGASQQLGNLATSQQALGLGDVNAMATLGEQQRQINQGASTFPMDVATQQAGLLRGYSIPTGVQSTYTGPIPGAYSASPLQQIAGLGTLIAALNQSPTGGGTTPIQNLISTLSGGGNFSNAGISNANTNAANQLMSLWNQGQIADSGTYTPLPGTDTSLDQGMVG
jgi:hypothetical protein